jgi:hypothetical protein
MHGLIDCQKHGPSHAHQYPDGRVWCQYCYYEIPAEEKDRMDKEAREKLGSQSVAVLVGDKQV